MRHSQQLHALAATARIANLPSVVSNVWLGVAVGAMATGGLADGRLWGRAATLAAAGACLYLAGNFFNDWADCRWDAQHRPERALPRGLFPPGSYLAVTLLGCLLGVGAAAAVDCRCLLVALLIVTCIVTYTRWHKRSAWAVVPLGLCRAMLPGLGFLGILAPGGLGSMAVIASSCGLLAHVAGLSLSARYESLAGPSGPAMGFSRALFPAVAVAMWFASYQGLSLPLATCLLGLLPYTLWIALCLTVWRRPVSRHVSNLLAGIPLVDWIVLLPLALAQGAHGWSALAAMSLLLPPLALLLGKLLQRLAPAT